jgi:prepilin signal peptidase PulO-like enzyme (type II secretory pathway)
LAIFIVDLEEKIIPDQLIYLGFVGVFILYLTSNFVNLYTHLFSGFLLASILLIISLVTKGKGMGLGDIKLTLLLGFILGWPLVLPFFLLAFLTGAFVGIILVLARRVDFGQPIPFGPFLIIAFWLVFIWGNQFFKILF